MNNVSKDRDLDSILVGDSDEFTHHITENDVSRFSLVSGDYNPLHMDESYAGGTSFGKRVVHGMFLGALVSQFVGMYLPGTKALLIKEMIEFKKPVYIGETVKVKGVITGKSTVTRIVEIDLKIFSNDSVVASGYVYAKVLD